jgi:hypothetical protein
MVFRTARISSLSSKISSCQGVPFQSIPIASTSGPMMMNQVPTRWTTPNPSMHAQFGPDP